MVIGLIKILSRADLIFIFGTALASIVYVAFAICAVVLNKNHRRSTNSYSKPVTVLKPVCGMDPTLYENLCSFCEQSYPMFQVVFGVRDASDPAIDIIKTVIANFPDRDLTLVVDDRTIGTNFKVSSLANMLRYAKYEILVIADSDMRVGPDYLETVVTAFDDPDVGAVTCLYIGTPVGGWASVLGAMFINEWFLPSVLVALSFEKLRYCFGATMAVRADALGSIGGFHALAFELADDHVLGKRLSERGYKIRLAPYIVENIVLEPDLRSLFLHELRWARTVRSVRPAGYALSFVTYALPMAILLLFATHFGALGMMAVVLAMGLRVLLHYVVRAVYHMRGPATPWLIPFRELLSFAVWGASFLGRNVQWRTSRLYLRPDGRLVLLDGKIDV